VQNIDEGLNKVIKFIQEKNYKEAENYILNDYKGEKNYLYFYCLGFINEEKNNLDDAIVHYKKSIEKKVDFYEAHFNLGTTFLKTKRPIEAKEIFLDLLKNLPDNYLLLFNLGLSYYENQEYPEALSFFNQSIIQNNKSYEAHHYIGMVYEKIGDLNKAINNYLLAEKLNKNHMNQTLNNLGTLLLKQKKINEAQSLFNKALLMNGDKDGLYFNLGAFYFEIAEPEKGLEYLKLSNSKKNNKRFIEKLLGAFHYTQNPVKETKEWLKLFRNNFKKDLHFNFDDRKFDKRKILIGFVSGDFINHPVGYYLLSVVKNLDKNIFSSIIYSNNSTQDETSEHIKKYVSQWTNVKQLTDLQLSERIYSDKIDILIDMSGHTELNRLGVFVNKPAPIQVSWAAYLASTGITEIDYILGDPYVLKKNFQENYIEKIYQLPHIWCSLSDYQIQLMSIPEPPYLKKKYITYGSLSNLNKINKKVIDVWSTILNKVSNSKLLIKSPQLNYSLVKDNLIKKFLENNISTDRLILLSGTNRVENMNTYSEIDISLDTFPYTGGTTNFEASWMGIPIVTMYGDSFISCCGESINTNLGMKKLIAKNVDDYIRLSIELGSNITFLKEIRDFLKLNSRNSVIFNDSLFTKHLEKAFIEMYKTFNSKIN